MRMGEESRVHARPRSDRSGERRKGGSKKRVIASETSFLFISHFCFTLQRDDAAKQLRNATPAETRNLRNRLCCEGEKEKTPDILPRYLASSLLMLPPPPDMIRVVFPLQFNRRLCHHPCLLF